MWVWTGRPVGQCLLSASVSQMMAKKVKTAEVSQKIDGFPRGNFEKDR